MAELAAEFLSTK